MRPSRSRIGRRAIVDGALLATLADEDGVVGQADNGAIAQGAQRRVVHRFTRGLVHDGEHLGQRAAICLGRGPAGQPLGHRVDHGDLALGFGDDHAIADRVQCRLQAFGFQTLAGASFVQSPGHLADQPTAEPEHGQRNHVGEVHADLQPRRLDEQQRGRRTAEHGGRHAFTKAAVPRRGHHRREEREVWDVVMQDGGEGVAHTRCRQCRNQRNQIGESSCDGHWEEPKDSSKRPRSNDEVLNVRLASPGHCRVAYPVQCE